MHLLEDYSWSLDGAAFLIPLRYSRTGNAVRHFVFIASLFDFPKGPFVMPEFSKNSPSESSDLIPPQKKVNAMLCKLVKLLSCLSCDHRRQRQFNGQLLDANREDIYVVMQQQMSSLR